MIEANASDFVAILQVLTREASGAAQPSMMEPVVSVLETIARRLIGSESVDQRLWSLWGAVEKDLAHKWNAAELARSVCMSEGQLRRLCHRSHQHSPIDHVTHLRMRRASTVLRSSSAKLEEIATQVGYGSVYSCSVAFSRWSGASRREVFGEMVRSTETHAAEDQWGW